MGFEAWTKAPSQQNPPSAIKEETGVCPFYTAWPHSLAKTGARLSLSATKGPAAVSVTTTFWVTASIPTPENTVYLVTP